MKFIVIVLFIGTRFINNFEAHLVFQRTIRCIRLFEITNTGKN